MDSKDRTGLPAGQWLGPKGRKNAKRVTAIAVMVRRDPGSLAMIDGRVYFERTAGNIPYPHVGVFSRRSYHGPRAQKLAHRLDISLRGHSLAVFPYLGEVPGAGVPLRKKPEDPAFCTGGLPWQYTMSLEFNSLPKSARVWDQETERWVECEPEEDKHGQE